MKPRSLTLSKYQPNFNDPRVKARVETVLAFCKPMLIQRKAKAISSTVLTQHFGNQNSALGGRLRYKLLQQEGTYTPGKQSYSYSLKPEGYAELAAAIGQDQELQTDIGAARELYGEIASGAVAPQYTEPTIGARRYTPVQNLPKSLRAQVFKGWFDYDIEAAAPTLVYQLACKVYRGLYPAKTEQPFPSIARLVDDRTSVRKHVADITGLDVPTAKGVVVALFFGAKLVPHQKQAIYRLVGMDWSIMDRLKADPFVSAFRREARSMWQYVLMDENAKNGRARVNGGPVILKAATKSKQRMAVYLRLERQVIDVVEALLLTNRSVPVLIHDGFMVQSRIDAKQFERVVQEKTGYSIRLVESQVGMQDEKLSERLTDEFVELIERQ
jgi:hypothetical protein